MATTARAARKVDWDARMYPLVINGVTVNHPSVTTHVSVINKPALPQWSAKSEKIMLLDRLKKFIWDSDGLSFGQGVLLEELNAIERAPLAYRGISSKAADIGTSAHAWIEWHIDACLGKGLGPEPILLPGADRAVEAFLKWEKEVEFEPISTETRVFNTENRYAGTEDGKGWIRGKRKLTDWKTSAAIYNEYVLQVHAYMAAPHTVRPDAPIDLTWDDLIPNEPVDGAVIVRFAKTADDKVPFEVREVPYNHETFKAYLAARDLWEWQRKAEGKSIGGPW